jgi:hypothetical protein
MVENSTSPVFLFIASEFSGNFTPDAYRFADAHLQSHRLTVYGVRRADFKPPVDFDTLISDRLEVPRDTKLVLWTGKNQQAIAFAGTDYSNLMAVLDTVGVFEKKNASGNT